MVEIKSAKDAVRTPDRVGGRGTWDSAPYEVTVDMAYTDESRNGALGLFITLVTDDGKRLRQTIWFTNKNKENFYTTPEGQKTMLPGFQLIDDLCKIATGKGIEEAAEEQRTINVYDFAQRKEVPVEKNVLVDLVGKKVHAAVWRVIDNKRVRAADGSYGPGPEKVEFNEIANVFYDDGTTVVERDAGKGPDFLPKWKKQWNGKPLYRYKDVGAAPAADQAAGSTPAASNPFA